MESSPKTKRKLSKRNIVLIALAIPLAGYALMIVVFAIAYALTPEGLCMENEVPVWHTTEGTISCAVEGKTLNAGWEIVRVGADQHIPEHLDDPDYKKWQQEVRDPMAFDE